MNIQLKTRVNGHFIDVMKAFDRQLFEALQPRYGKMEIVSFTGTGIGDKVHLRFYKPIKAEWVSVVTHQDENDYESFFIDEGEQLPYPLTHWTHKHIVRKITENSSLIIDDISFEVSDFFLSLIMYPAIYAAFYPRKKVYKAYFRKGK